jgi:hypothetical protein
MVSDTERRALFEALNRQLGDGPAATLMELLPPVGWGDVARQSDLVAVRGEMAMLRGEMSELRGEMAEIRGEIASVRSELKGDIAQLRGEFAELRGEVAALSARVDAQLPRFLWANVPVMFGVAGLVLAAAKFA